MRLRVLLAVTVLAAALPALAQPTCAAPYVAQGNNCTFSTAFGWAVAGQGNASIVTLYVPPNASGPVDFEITAVSSSLGSNYTGYFGFKAGGVGQPESKVYTLADVQAGGPAAIGAIAPGRVLQFAVTGICWDPTCTSAAPAGAVPNMFSLQLILSSPNPGDLDITPNPQVTVQYFNGNQVTFEVKEGAARSNSLYSIIPGINLGATPEERYVFNGGAVTQPFGAISVSNLNNTLPISGTLTIQDLQGNSIASAPIPAIRPGGAAGYLVIGRTPGDTLGLFPSSTVLPADSDGIFHGILVVGMNGQTVGGMCIILAQEYNGNTMLNLPVYHSPVP